MTIAFAFNGARAMVDLWEKSLFHLEHGNFSALEDDLGGPEGFDRQIVAFHAAGKFDGQSDMLAEALTCACMLGRTETARYLIESGVDPYAGMKTWLAGPHYAVSGGHIDTVRMLIDSGISLEVKNLHGGTLLGQALWSMVNEPKPEHALIIENLILAGATVEDGTLEWWQAQDVPDNTTKAQVSRTLMRSADFNERLDAAKQVVKDAESSGSKRALADSLKNLGNILRRPPFLRRAANEVYARAAELYRDLGLPLEEAWVKRHIGIIYEYAGDLTKAERYYDESLELFRQNAGDDNSNYANTVRYPAVIKNRVGKRAESAALWEEAVRRYDEMRQPVGVAEGAAWLTIFAIEKGDMPLANDWFEKAEAAASAANDPDTDIFVAEVRSRFESAKKPN